MASGEITLGTDYSNVWTELNKARTRLGVPALSVPDVKGNHATSEQMHKMQSDIEATRTSDSRISSKYGPTVLTGIDVGNIMLYSTINTAINTAINYQGVPICSCQSHESDYGDVSNLSLCGCWGDSGCPRDMCEDDCSCHGTCYNHEPGCNTDFGCFRECDSHKG